jgi:hypothetical protein
MNLYREYDTYKSICTYKEYNRVYTYLRPDSGEEWVEAYTKLRTTIHVYANFTQSK